MRAALLLIAASLCFAQTTILGPTKVLGPAATAAASGGASITVGTPQASAQFFSVTSESYSVTVAATAHPALVVATWNDGHTTTGCTYNGVSMTALSSNAIGAIGYVVSDWILINPATGANTLVCNFSGSNNSIGGVVVALPFYGVNQTGTVGNSWRTLPSPAGSGGSPSANASITVTTVSGDVVVDMVNEYNVTLGASGAGQADQYGPISTDGFGNTQGRGMSTITATTTSTIMTWTFASTFWNQLAVALIPG